MVTTTHPIRAKHLCQGIRLITIAKNTEWRLYRNEFTQRVECRAMLLHGRRCIDKLQTLVGAKISHSIKLAVPSRRRLMPHNMHGKRLTTLSLQLTGLVRFYKRPTNQTARLIKTQALSKWPLPLPTARLSRNDALLWRLANTPLTLVAMKGQPTTICLKHLQLCSHPIKPRVIRPRPTSSQGALTWIHRVVVPNQLKARCTD